MDKVITSKPTVWIIGAKGMLGTELRVELAAKGYAVLSSDRDVDIRDPEALAAFAAGKRIDWILNCSAYTAVDKAEEEFELARAINATGAANIAACAKESGARLIHLSTDYVFSGKGEVDAHGMPRPHVETDPVAPTTAYGRSKAEGEALVLERNPSSFILRTAWLYGAHGPNFVATMLRLMAEKPAIGVVCDQYGAPTWTRDLSGAIEGIIARDSRRYGIYHASGEGVCTWYDFAIEIQQQALESGLLETAIPIKPLRSHEYPTKAARPAWSVLSKEKLGSVLGIRMPEWRTSLADYLNEQTVDI